ncbi:MAG TPA: hypothetical protein VFZ97_06705 [Acidimicrobiales bacterium]
MDLLWDLFAGFLVDFLPFEFGETRTIRRYRQGRRIIFQGRVEGLRPNLPIAGYLAVQDGQLWVTDRKAEGGNILPVPGPKPQSALTEHTATLRGEPWSVSYESDQGTIRIIPTTRNRILLEAVLADARRRNTL